MTFEQMRHEINEELKLFFDECERQMVGYEAAADILEAEAKEWLNGSSTQKAFGLLRERAERQAEGFKALKTDIGNWLLCAALVLCLLGCSPMKTYQKTEVYRAAPVGAKALRQYADNYACPGCLSLPDGQTAQPGQWVAIDGEGKIESDEIPF